MRHIRDLDVDITFSIRTCPGRLNTIQVGHNTQFHPQLGGDETDWADRLGIVTLVKERMGPAPLCYRCKLNIQRRFVKVLWLLGLSYSSGLRVFVSMSRLYGGV